MSQTKPLHRPALQGLLIVVSGPSGVGKNTILAEASRHLPGLGRSVSVTTRPPRSGEEDGRDYFFCSPEKFQQLVEKDGLLEWARYLDYCYGTPKQWVFEKLQAGQDIALEIDVQGGRQIKEQFPDAVLIFVMPPSEEALRERLRGRNTETEESLDRRVKAYRKEFEEVSIYDYVIVNDALEEAVALFCCIVRAEKARVKRGAADG